MKDRKKYPQDLLDRIPSGFAGDLELLRYDYEMKCAEVCGKLSTLAALRPGLSEAEEWKKTLEKNCNAFGARVQSSSALLSELEEKVRVGQLALANEQVCADVSAAEAVVLSRLTELQRLNSDSLKPVFSLQLPALLKTLDGESKKLLRDAIGLQTENSQYFSNELQHLAIMLKERNKTITHPLDENHPE